MCGFAWDFEATLHFTLVHLLLGLSQGLTVQDLFDATLRATLSLDHWEEGTACPAVTSRVQPLTWSQIDLNCRLSCLS